MEAEYIFNLMSISKQEATAIAKLVQENRGRIDPELLAEAGQQANKFAAALFQHDQLERPSIAQCKSGCAYCCYLQVEISWAEAWAIARWLQVNHPEALSALLEVANHRLNQIAPLNTNTRVEAKIPCMFLDSQNRCRIYPVRPLVCGGYNSVDVDCCKDGFGVAEAQIPMQAEQAFLYGAVREGIDQAMDYFNQPPPGELHAMIGQVLSVIVNEQKSIN